MILKIWHQWGWLYHLMVTAVMATVFIMGYGNAVAGNSNRISVLEKQHTDENMAIRMAVMENTIAETNKRLGNIEDVEGKIFDRINQIADRESNGR